jgi:hypothetical protein
MSGDHNMNQKKPMIKIDGVEINQTTPYIDYDAWMASPLTKALKDKLEAAVAAERERLLSTDIHSCHANCERFACVQTRRAVAAEREACAKVIDDLSLAHPGRADLTALQCAAAIRARGQE